MPKQEMPSKNLIIFDHAAYLPKGDSPQRLYELASNLSCFNVHTTLVGSGYDHRSRREIKFRWYQLWRSEYVDSVRYVWLRLPVYKNFRMRILNMALYPIVSFLCFLTGYLGRPDCVMGSSPHILAPVAARLVSLVTKTSFIFEVRDLWPDSIIDVLGAKESNLAIRIMRWIERHLFEKADQVISVLPRLHNYIEDRGFRLKHPPTWIPNGVSTRSIPFSLPDQNEDRIVYFGAVGPANGLSHLLAIWQHVEEISTKAELEIIGDGPSLPELKKIKNELGLTRVFFRGFMDTKADLYSRASRAASYIIYIPKRNIYKYGVGANKIAEYLALGRPFIYIGEGLSDDLREKSFTLALSSEEDSKEIARRILAFIEKIKERKELDARLAREIACSDYSYEKLAKKLYEVCFFTNTRIMS